VVHDFSKDDSLSPNDLYSLAERYKAFSGSQLQAYTLPTVGASSSAGSVQVVQPDGPSGAAQMISQFLGGPLGTITTPPLSAYGHPLTLTVPPTTAPPATTTAPPSTKHVPTPPAAPSIPPFDPRPC
jgi:hypothetical protein